MGVGAGAEQGPVGLRRYLPAQDISLGVVTTQLPKSSANGVGNATILFARLSEYLTPSHRVEIPGIS